MKGFALGFWKPLGNWIVDHRLIPGRSWCDSTVFYSPTLGYDCLLSPCLKWECFLWSEVKTITKTLFAKWIYYFIISKWIYFYLVNIKSCYFGVTFTMHPSLWPPRHPTALELVPFTLSSHAGLSTSGLSCTSLLHFEESQAALMIPPTLCDCSSVSPKHYQNYHSSMQPKLPHHPVNISLGTRCTPDSLCFPSVPLSLWWRGPS